VCESPLGQVIHTQLFEASDVTKEDASVDIICCSNCGCGFSDLTVSQADLDSSYEEHSKYADMTVFAKDLPDDPFSAESPWDLARLKGTAEWISAHFLDRDISMLDAGCATGTLLGLLKRDGFRNLTGLDPSPTAIDRARHSHGVIGFPGSFCRPPRDIGKFDLIVLSHVLEHIADVQSAINGLTEMTKEGGYVYLEVPNAMRYHEYLIAPFHDFNDEHVNHFSGNILDRLMKSRGFEAVHIGEKEVLIAPTAKYPAVFGLWKKSGKVARVSEVDAELIGALQTYVKRSSDLDSEINERLSSKLNDTPTAIWGAGNLALKLLRGHALRGRTISAIVDGSLQRQGLSIGNLRVQSPSSLVGFKGDVIVMSLHHAESITESAKQTCGDGVKIIRLDN
jgi:2-polyprenyl-3-methyl-5-hydroxy-6-metoxy-1,4-benzoquinol methylase